MYFSSLLERRGGLKPVTYLKTFHPNILTKCTQMSENAVELLELLRKKRLFMSDESIHYFS